LSVLARAVARPDAAMVRRLLDHLGGLGESDEGALIGALRTAFRREEPLPANATESRQGEWRARTFDLLKSYPHIDRLLSRLSWSMNRWRRIAAGALDRLEPGELLVIYGLGLNGRALLDTPELQRARVYVIDDNPSAAADKPRLSLADSSRPKSGRSSSGISPRRTRGSSSRSNSTVDRARPRPARGRRRPNFRCR
jgi:hypothetical protein